MSVNEAKDLGSAVVDRETGQGFTTLADPRAMTDDELAAEIRDLESRVYTLKCEGAKMWRLRLRAGIATEADKARLAVFNKRRAALSPQASQTDQESIK